MTLIALAVAALLFAWLRPVLVARHRRRGGRAGGSAAAQARRLRTPLVRLAALLGIQTSRGRQADRWQAGAIGEQRTADRLEPLRTEGWTVLHDRALPRGRANLDHLVISPAGVVAVVDSKRWTSRYRLRVVGGRLLHGTTDVTGRLSGVRHEARTVARELGCSVVALVAMDGPPIDGGELVIDGIRIVPADQVTQMLRTCGGGRTHTSHARELGRRAGELFPPYGK